MSPVDNMENLIAKATFGGFDFELDTGKKKYYVYRKPFSMDVAAVCYLLQEQ